MHVFNEVNIPHPGLFYRHLGIAFTPRSIDLAQFAAGTALASFPTREVEMMRLALRGCARFVVGLAESG
jgi:hypothetical protein